MAGLQAETAAILMGLLPGVEPRYIVPILAPRLGVCRAALVAAIEAVLLALLLAHTVSGVSGLLDRFSHRLGVLGRVYRAARVRALEKKAIVEKYGVVGLAAFVAVPLPLTGIYTGSLVALLAGLDRVRTFLSLAVGGVLSVLIVAMSTMGLMRLVW